MDKDIFRNKLAKVILAYNIILFVTMLILTFVNGYIFEEFQEIAKIIAPVHAVYLAAAVKYVTSKSNPETSNLNDLNATYLTAILGTYGISILTIIILGAINIIPYDLVTNTIPIIEITLGTYSSILVANIFEVNTQ